ncbi:hypothetical protein PCIT_b0126 [Pseudoalteromonas citrea]|uniref:DUF4153 domain-containing protein n=2 Tax=Pseudoalteromonas citrea TaxID=43655 RepID=A0AAD4AE26_9GAMM|nr:DUF4153 domain-containing protein [Pseudoalteromonas citrea]KAF7764197.1 hypothetical protein PCIT_b0126 [Pseudoalteromonas citrea]
MISNHSELTKIQYKSLLFVALLQGLALLLLHQALEFKWAIAESSATLFACYSIAIILPILSIYGISQKTTSKYYWFIGLFSLFFAALGAYTGSQIVSLSSESLGMYSFTYGLVMTVAVFKVLLFSQALSNHSDQWYIDYNLLIQRACHLFITLFFAALFTLAMWLILILWAELFAAINITLFQRLFYEPWFFYPMLTLSHTLGVLKVRDNANVVNTVNRLIQVLSLALLPLLVMLSSLFLVALLFQGMQPIWDNGGSALIFTLLIAILLTLNTALQSDEGQLLKHHWTQIALTLGVILLPVYVAISGYGLYQRIEQYGLSVDRLWAILIWVFVAAYFICYSAAIIKYRVKWYAHLGNINTKLGLTLVAALLATQSPLLDFRKLSVSSQLAHINSGHIDINDVDLDYFAFNLGRPGNEALKQLQQEYGSTNPALNTRIDAVLKRVVNPYGNPDIEQLDVTTLLQPNAYLSIEQLPLPLLSRIQNYAKHTNTQLFNSKKLDIVAIDLHGDIGKEYLLIAHFEYYFEYVLFYQLDGEWLEKSMDITHNANPFIEKQVINALIEQQYSTQEPKFKDIVVNGETMQVR